MTIDLDVTYDDSNNFAFDSTQVEFMGAKACLKLVDAPFNTVQDFSSDVGFTYDSGKTEFVAGALRKISQLETDASLGFNFNTSINADWSLDGSVTSTVNGGASVIGSELDCTGSSTKGIYAAKDRTLAGAIKVRYKPNYNGGGIGNKEIFAATLDSTDLDELFFFHSSSGNSLRVTCHNNVGGLHASAVTIGTYTAVAGVYNEIEINYDSASGAIAAYVDGVRIGAINIGAWTRGTGTGRGYIGAVSGGPYNNSNATFDDVIFFDTVQHTAASYTPGYTVVDTIYPADLVLMPTFNYSGLGEIQGVDTITPTGTNPPTVDVTFTTTDIDASFDFLASNDQQEITNLQIDYRGQLYYQGGALIRTAITLSIDELNSLTRIATVPGSDKVLLLFYQAGTYYWFSGGVLVVSDGSIAQSNTEAEIAAVVPYMMEGSFSIVVNLVSDDGSTTPAITSFNINFLFFFAEFAVDTCQIYGKVLDNSGAAVQGAKVAFDGPDYFYLDTFVSRKVDTISGADGTFIIAVVEGASTGKKVSCQISYPGGPKNIYPNLDIPNEVSKSLAQVIIDSA